MMPCKICEQQSEVFEATYAMDDVIVMPELVGLHRPALSTK